MHAVQAWSLLAAYWPLLAHQDLLNFRTNAHVGTFRSGRLSATSGAIPSHPSQLLGHFPVNFPGLWFRHHLRQNFLSSRRFCGNDFLGEPNAARLPKRVDARRHTTCNAQCLMLLDSAPRAHRPVWCCSCTRALPCPRTTAHTCAHRLGQQMHNPARLAPQPPSYSNAKRVPLRAVHPLTSRAFKILTTAERAPSKYSPPLRQRLQNTHHR